MGFRLTNKAPSQARDVEEPKAPKPKLFFVVEGAETEGLYIREFKNAFVDKILGEIVFLDREDGTKSHQLIVVKSIDTYFKLTTNLNEDVIHQIGVIKEEILTETESTLEGLQEKLNLIHQLIGDENYQILFGNLALVKDKPLEMLNAIVELKGFEHGIDKSYREAPIFFILYTFLIAIGAGLVLVPEISLYKVMLAAQVINGILLPPILIFMLLLVNNQELMGKYLKSKK